MAANYPSRDQPPETLSLERLYKFPFILFTCAE